MSTLTPGSGVRSSGCGVALRHFDVQYVFMASPSLPTSLLEDCSLDDFQRMAGLLGMASN